MLKSGGEDEFKSYLNHLATPMCKVFNFISPMLMSSSEDEMTVKLN